MQGNRPKGFFAAPQAHLDAYFRAPLHKILNLTRAQVQIVRAGCKSDANAFHFGLNLALVAFAFSLLAVVLEFAEIHNPADGNRGVWRDFNKVKSALLRRAERRGGLNDAEIFSLLVNDADRRMADILIYAIAAVDGAKK